MELGKMVKRVLSLQGTNDVNSWEENFLEHVDSQTEGGKDTRSLSERQIDVIEKLFHKHFAG